MRTCRMISLGAIYCRALVRWAIQCPLVDVNECRSCYAGEYYSGDRPRYASEGSWGAGDVEGAMQLKRGARDKNSLY